MTVVRSDFAFKGFKKCSLNNGSLQRCMANHPRVYSEHDQRTEEDYTLEYMCFLVMLCACSGLVLAAPVGLLCVVILPSYLTSDVCWLFIVVALLSRL